MVRLRVVEANKESNKIIIIIVTIHTSVFAANPIILCIL